MIGVQVLAIPANGRSDLKHAISTSQIIGSYNPSGFSGSKLYTGRFTIRLLLVQVGFFFTSGALGPS